MKDTPRQLATALFMESGRGED